MIMNPEPEALLVLVLCSSPCARLPSWLPRQVAGNHPLGILGNKAVGAKGGLRLWRLRYLYFLGTGRV